MKPRNVRCPQCGSMAEYRLDNPSRPFCSERCKLIDLGAWAEERYSIAGAPMLLDSNGIFPVDESQEAAGVDAKSPLADRNLDS